MILFLVVGDLQIPYYLVHSDLIHTMYRSLPSWYTAYAVVGLASNIAIIIGMWTMKRWSAYLLSAYFALKILVDSFYLLPDKRLVVLATTVAGAVLWFWAVSRKWKQFS